MTFGQPPDTASMNFEVSRSDGVGDRELDRRSARFEFDRAERLAFGFELGFVLVLPADHQAPWRSASTISPGVEDLTCARHIFHGDPAVHGFRRGTPNQYCFMNSASVSADHSFSGVVRM
jgi:hypothetical protein